MKYIRRIPSAPGKSYIEILKELKKQDNKKGSLLNRLFLLVSIFNDSYSIVNIHSYLYLN